MHQIDYIQAAYYNVICVKVCFVKRTEFKAGCIQQSGGFLRNGDVSAAEHILCANLSTRKKEKTVFVQIEDDFDLVKIGESGQCFRWTKLQVNSPVAAADSPLTYRILA